ncbi:hypothetical protein F6J61_05445 [Clostridium perfringens]
MNFEIKQIKRAYRDIENIMSDILSTNDASLYKTYVSRFINSVSQNEILSYILNPFFALEVNVLQEKQFGFGLTLNMPPDIDKQIAFVLQSLKEFSNMSSDRICMSLFQIYNKKSLSDNIYPWNNDVVRPVFREILIKISDLIEDIPSDKKEVDSRYMTIINNYGNYNSANGQVANGNQNTLTNNINSDDIFKELIEKVNNNVKDNEKEELIKLIEELKAEKDKPGFKGKLSEFIAKTAKYTSVFIDLWGKLNELAN